MNEFEIVNKFNYKKDYKYLDDVINHTLDKLNVEKACLSIIFIDDTEMHELNKKYRGINRTTDVLSFALEDNNTFPLPIRELGDIFVSIPKMQAQAVEYEHSEKRELSFLVCHGLLHLLGYDHTKSKEEEEKQFSLQEEILNDLNIVL
ncbi:MAG: rRNA maturation RNase YbeY [Bacilli bacterium]|nr:rRNA maturation RNase YbeY [Bacilli bacterium]